MDLQQLVSQAEQQISELSSLAQIEELRVTYFGKKGHFSLLMQDLRNVPPEQRPEIGALINQAKEQVQNLLNSKKELLETAELNQKLAQEKIDVTLSGRNSKIGGLHPVNITIERIVGFFKSMGFQVASGPEIESDYYNFDALNIPDYHPARADHDTFWFDANRLLRTQTSGVQIRTMSKAAQEQQLPLRIIAPGKVYRNDYDQTHTPMFHQIELLFVDKNVHFTQLKGIIQSFLDALFEDQTHIRFRPSYFPFTEPGAEVDVMSKNGKWLEVLGCGMVHPKVLENAGIDPNVYSGFAVGMGVERLTMLRYGVDDLRSFFENDIRFLQQFN